MQGGRSVCGGLEGIAVWVWCVDSAESHERCRVKYWGCRGVARRKAIDEKRESSQLNGGIGECDWWAFHNWRATQQDDEWVGGMHAGSITPTGMKFEVRDVGCSSGKGSALDVARAGGLSGVIEEEKTRAEIDILDNRYDNSITWSDRDCGVERGRSGVISLDANKSL
nr:hypothetical protein Iba_chr02dCG12100 [Ipomoea batatas]